jgi:hypothetical protein
MFIAYNVPDGKQADWLDRGQKLVSDLGIVFPLQLKTKYPLFGDLYLEFFQKTKPRFDLY